MIPRMLVPLKGNISNSKPIFSFDVETYQEKKSNGIIDFTEQYFQMGAVAGCNMKKIFWDKKEMQDFLLSRTTRDSLIFATNLDFDFNMLFGGSREVEGMHLIDRQGLIFAKKSSGGHTWQFLDTLNFTKSSVKKLGKMLGKPKMAFPEYMYGKAASSPEEKSMFEKYCLQDAEITLAFAEYFRNYCNIMGQKMKATIASTGLDYWRRHGQPAALFQERREWLELHYNGVFRGGRTEVFKRGIFKNIYGYDFKSMHPSVCHDGVDGQGSYPNPNSVHRIIAGDESYIMEYEGISDVTMRCPYMYIPLIGIKSAEHKLYFPYGKFSGWLTHVEIREAVNAGYSIREIRDTIYYTEHFIPFRNSVEKLFAVRMKFKKENNDMMYNLVKIQMNSGLYGKFSQNIDNKVEMFSADDLRSDDDGTVYVVKDGKRHDLENFTQCGSYVFNNVGKPEKIPLFIFPILSSYTSALAKIKLWKKLNRYPEEMIYTDTDSLFMLSKKFSSSEKLGELELQYTPETAVFIRPKQYYLNEAGKEIIKNKGIPSKYLRSYSSFMDAIENGVDMMRFTKVRESAIRKIPYGSIISMKKAVTLEDDKRRWKGKFSFKRSQDSRPLLAEA